MDPKLTRKVEGKDKVRETLLSAERADPLIRASKIEKCKLTNQLFASL